MKDNFIIWLLQNFSVLGIVVLSQIIFSRHSNAESTRIKPDVLEKYSGQHEEAFVADSKRVLELMKYVLERIGETLGFQGYQEGFNYPFTIRFTDGSAAPIPNVGAYTYFKSDQMGVMAQEMVLDLDVLTAYPQDFDREFIHELTHAVVHDDLGSKSRNLTPWFDEGVAIYVAGDGESWVEHALRRAHLKPEPVLTDLDGPQQSTRYPQYFLAIQALLEKVGQEGLKKIIQRIFEGRTPEEAIQDVSGLSWDAFQVQVHSYSLRKLNEMKTLILKAQESETKGL